MGSAHSNLAQSSEVGTLNWDKSEDNKEYLKNGYSIKKLDNGMEEIDLEIKPLSESENSISQLSDVFKKLRNEISKNEIKTSNDDIDDTSPFISTELYNKILENGDNSSPLISTDMFINEIKKGGSLHNLSSSSSSSSSFSNSSESSTSDDDLIKALSDISVSSSDYPTLKKKEFKKFSDNKSKYHSSSSSTNLKGYNFSDTSSMMSNYKKGGNTSETSISNHKQYSSETSYKINSESIKSSDINLVSVDSVNGRRFLN